MHFLNTIKNFKNIQLSYSIETWRGIIPLSDLEIDNRVIISDAISDTGLLKINNIAIALGQIKDKEFTARTITHREAF